MQRKEFKEIKINKEKRLRSLIEDPPILELEKLQDHLEYAILGKGLKLPMFMALNVKVN